MVAWNAVVGFLAVVLSMLTTAYSGNLGFAIITLSLITRLALLPLTLRMARHAQAQQRILQTIKREIDELKAKYKSSPQKLGTELSKLYQKHGVKPIDGVNSLGLIVQLLLGAGVYSAIRRGLGAGGRFFWIRNLAQPDAILAVATGVLTGAASLLGHDTCLSKSFAPLGLWNSSFLPRACPRLYSVAALLTRSGQAFAAVPQTRIKKVGQVGQERPTRPRHTFI